MSSCHLSLAKPEFYLQNFRVEAPESLPEAVLTPRAWVSSSSMQPQNPLQRFWDERLQLPKKEHLHCRWSGAGARQLRPGAALGQVRV
jgi:hypothetical protein